MIEVKEKPKITKLSIQMCQEMGWSKSWEALSERLYSDKDVWEEK